MRDKINSESFKDLDTIMCVLKEGMVKDPNTDPIILLSAVILKTNASLKTDLSGISDTFIAIKNILIDVENSLNYSKDHLSSISKKIEDLKNSVSTPYTSDTLCHNISGVEVSINKLSDRIKTVFDEIETSMAQSIYSTLKRNENGYKKE